MRSIGDETSKTRRAYTWDFKASAVRRMTEGGYSATQLARDLGVHPDTLRRWKKQCEKRFEQYSSIERISVASQRVTGRPHTVRPREEGVPGKGHVKAHGELGRLRREMEQLKQDILNKSAPMNTTRGTDVQVANATVAHTEGVALSELLGALVGSRWLVAGMVFLLFLLGLGHVLLTQPVYRADALLQVEETAEVLGALADRADFFAEEAGVVGQLELLQSRRILDEVVDNLKLDIVARPLYFPLMGAAVARRNASAEKVADPWFGLRKYAWGGESIEIETFDIPASYRGETFTLVAGKNGGYQLLDPNGDLLADGVVGEPIKTSLALGEPLTLLVSNLRARPGTHFGLIREPRLALIDALKSSVMVKEKGEQSGLLQISLEGRDRKKIAATINEIADIYVHQNLERKSAEAEKTLNFLEEQLPRIKQRMEGAEAALSNYRLRQGSADLPGEMRNTLQRIVSIEAQLSQLNEERQELAQKYKPDHPDYSRIAALDAQVADLNGELEALNSKVKSRPATQQEIMRLSRDVEVNAQLYVFLLNRIQELKVVKAGPVSNVRIVDYAPTPYKPVRSKRSVITIYLLLGVLFGVAAAFLRHVLWGGVEDPDVVEKQLGLPVYAVVPHSAKEEKLFKHGQHNGATKGVLAAVNPKEPAVESLRALRTSLHSALLEANSNAILITSPGPAVGKSFVSVNLGAILASANNRTLIIEADLRKGHLNKHLGINSEAGLSDLIAGDISIEQVIYETGIDKLSIMPAGTKPPNPSELLLHERFASALEEISPHFDHVIIDSPPVLAVTDAAILGRFAGAALLVVKAGMHPLHEIERSAKRLNQAGVDLCGVVFNDTKASSFKYGRYYSYASYSSKD